MTMWPFFTFYGGKWRSAKHYPSPEYSTVVEPFAGSAGYSVRHYEKNISLYDIDPKIVGVWEYLIAASKQEILSLPVSVGHVDDLAIPQEAKWLIGFWLNKGAASPQKTPSAWMRSPGTSTQFWGPEIRGRIAQQIEGIRHWRVDLLSYEEIPLGKGTWFVDPPYSGPAGRHYRHDKVDYEHLASWCRSLCGQVMVCENDGATWLPFERFRSIKSNESSRGKSVSRESIWTNA